jgi:hypothetical protein
MCWKSLAVLQSCSRNSSVVLQFCSFAVPNHQSPNLQIFKSPNLQIFKLSNLQIISINCQLSTTCPFLRFLPNLIHLIQRHIPQAAALFEGLVFKIVEPADEFPVCSLKGGFRINSIQPCSIDK